MSVKRRMKFVSDRLSMPLFVLGRNRIMEHGLNDMRQYLTKRSTFYTKSCKEENATENVTKRHLKDLAGFYKQSPHFYSCPHSRSTPYSRGFTQSKAWQMAPNRYAVPLPIGASRKGMSGAYWRMEKKIKVESVFMTKKTPPKRKPNWRFYNLPSDFDRMRHECNIHKGVFVSNPRERRPTTRSMVTNPMMCYHDPDEPSPATYYPHLHELNYKKEKIVTEPRNPHLFNRLSSVPAKMLSYEKRHTSFQPGPGRYVSRFINVCPCSVNRIYMPGIQWIIDREKRHKFRRLPFTKIRARSYCSPEFAHVVGKGHRHLFKNIPKRAPRLEKTSKATNDRLAEKMTAPVRLYANAKYIALINNPKVPKRVPYPLELLFAPPKRIRYHCRVKRRRRRRKNQNIAFNSTQERFPDLDKPAILTTAVLERARARLPPDRRLTDRPVMRRSPEEIVSKLTSTPQHQLCHKELELRKRDFKFQPMPKPKLLVTIEDIRGPTKDGVHRTTKYSEQPDVTFYFKKVKPQHNLDEI